MTEVTNSRSTTLREYASILDSTQKGMAIFLRQVADEIDLTRYAIYKLLYNYDELHYNSQVFDEAISDLVKIIDYKL